jgi:hypothetical protein
VGSSPHLAEFARDIQEYRGCKFAVGSFGSLMRTVSVIPRIYRTPVSRTPSKFTGIFRAYYHQNPVGDNVSGDNAGMPPPLRGLKVVDLTRILAGPTGCLQLYRNLHES